jgi:hypothetical protein
MAECLAAKLGYRCIDRDVIVEKAAACGVAQEELRAALTKPPTFLDRFQHKKYIYLTLIQAALAEEIRGGKAVYHGNAGHLLLRGGRHICRTRIIAPLELRVAMARERLKLARDEAIAYIQKADHDRRKWTQFLYGVDWGDPSLYDVVINLECLCIDGACDIIATVARQKCFEFTADTRAAFDDLALASRVMANLAIDPGTSNLEVEATAQGGSVAIKGKLLGVHQLDEVLRVARQTSGVTKVDTEGLGFAEPRA